MRDFLTAMALVLVIEGVVYAAFPDAMQRMMRHALAMPPGVLRWSGLAAALVGLGLVAAVRFAYYAG